jgi:hypothetical protein
MKRLINIILFTIFLFFTNGYSVLAAAPTETRTPIVNPIEIGDLGALITKLSGIVTPLAVLGFIFSVIAAGWVRMTAAGNPEKEGKSMKMAVSAAIGFAIIALAPLIVKVFAKLIGVNTEILS